MRPPLTPPPLAIPVVTPPEDPAAGADPVAFAVPNVLVPGVVGAAAAFPTPLGSLTVLLSPPGDAGPFRMPLVAAEPAPADPAFGVAVAVPVPADEPLAAPPVEAPPPADPPPPPEPPPPPLWAKALSGESKTAIRINFAGSGVDMCEISLCALNATYRMVVPNARAIWQATVKDTRAGELLVPTVEGAGSLKKERPQLRGEPRTFKVDDLGVGPPLCIFVTRCQESAVIVPTQ